MNLIKMGRYYCLAAEQGSADAQAALGCLYEKGLGVSQDYTQAARFAMPCFDHGRYRVRADCLKVLSARG